MNLNRPRPLAVPMGKSAAKAAVRQTMIRSIAGQLGNGMPVPSIGAGMKLTKSDLQAAIRLAKKIRDIK